MITPNVSLSKFARGHFNADHACQEGLKQSRGLNRYLSMRDYHLNCIIKRVNEAMPCALDMCHSHFLQSFEVSICYNISLRREKFCKFPAKFCKFPAGLI